MMNSLLIVRCRVTVTVTAAGPRSSYSTRIIRATMNTFKSNHVELYRTFLQRQIIELIAIQIPFLPYFMTIPAQDVHDIIAVLGRHRRSQSLIVQILP